MKNFALIVAGLIFSAITAIHLWRVYKPFDVVINQFNVPTQWSLYAGVVTGILALWMFIAAAKRNY